MSRKPTQPETVQTPEPATREVTGHRVNPANDKLKIEVLDAPGAGGANHKYAITGMNMDGNPSFTGTDAEYVSSTMALVVFQNGPIAEAGVNGVTQEALIAILIDRLQSFQKGDFACRENALAITKLEEAAHWLHHRTHARMARGVEGTNVI